MVSVTPSYDLVKCLIDRVETLSREAGVAQRDLSDLRTAHAETLAVEIARATAAVEAKYAAELLKLREQASLSGNSAEAIVDVAAKLGAAEKQIAAIEADLAAEQKKSRRLNAALCEERDGGGRLGYERDLRAEVDRGKATAKALVFEVVKALDGKLEPPTAGEVLDAALDCIRMSDHPCGLNDSQKEGFQSFCDRLSPGERWAALRRFRSGDGLPPLFLNLLESLGALESGGVVGPLETAPEAQPEPHSESIGELTVKVVVEPQERPDEIRAFEALKPLASLLKPEHVSEWTSTEIFEALAWADEYRKTAGPEPEENAPGLYPIRGFDGRYRISEVDGAEASGGGRPGPSFELVEEANAYTWELFRKKSREACPDFLRAYVRP